MSTPNPAVGIVEDGEMFRKALTSIVETLLRWNVAFATGSARVASDRVRSQPLDLLVLDLELDDGVGTDVGEALATLSHRPPICVVSIHHGRYTLERVTRIDAQGFVDKCNTTPEELAAAFQTVVAGGRWYSPCFTQWKAACRREGSEFRKAPKPRDERLLGLIGNGLAVKQIAYDLDVPGETIRKHIYRLLQKLNLPGLSNAVTFAVKNGFDLFFRPKR